DVVGAEGTVTLRLGQEGERVFAQVEDDGPGIPAEVRDHLFEAFFTTKGDGGTGLGLALSRSFVEAHGGTLDVAGTGPEGTVFRLELPARAAPENRPSCSAADEDAPSDAAAPVPEAATPAEAAPVPEAAAPLDAALGSEPRDRPRVLVVDDEPALVRALARWLRADATVTGVTSPSAALSRLADERFDLLLCDLHMPELGGDALARKVRALPNAPRVVVMTGSAAPAPEDLTYVRKPLDRAQLRAVLAG
ncbi:MAG: ATP-binding protein, partial [Myxococcota bacterium]